MLELNEDGTCELLLGYDEEADEDISARFPAAALRQNLTIRQKGIFDEDFRRLESFWEISDTALAPDEREQQGKLDSVFKLTRQWNVEDAQKALEEYVSTYETSAGDKGDGDAKPSVRDAMSVTKKWLGISSAGVRRQTVVTERLQEMITQVGHRRENMQRRRISAQAHK